MLQQGCATKENVKNQVLMIFKSILSFLVFFLMVKSYLFYPIIKGLVQQTNFDILNV